MDILRSVNVLLRFCTCWEMLGAFPWLHMVTMVFFPCVFPSHVSEERVVIKRMGNFALVKVLWSFVEFRSAVPCLPQNPTETRLRRWPGREISLSWTERSEDIEGGCGAMSGNVIW